MNRRFTYFVGIVAIIVISCSKGSRSAVLSIDCGGAGKSFAADVSPVI